ncbi:MAG: TlpA family protein disulfide reductase [Bacteroidetes bacterium]|nr:TlpA family protein disulfide reductase [Bacteroidota bacterium]
MNNKLKYVIFAVLAVLTALYFFNKYKVAPGINLSQLSLSDLSGQPVKLEEFKGKKIILTFGASWCGNCIMEMKSLNQIKESELNDVEIICISDEALDVVQSFKERKNYPFIFLKMNGSFASIGIHAIPTTYILNKDFKIKYEKVGEIDWKDASTVEYMKKLME